jgi:hypothetical protein
VISQDTPQADATWVAQNHWRSIGWVLVVVMFSIFAFAGVATFLQNWNISSVFGGVIYIALGIAVVYWFPYRFFVYSRIIVSPTGLEVRNPLRTYDIGWIDVESISMTSEGLIISTRSGEGIRAWAVQKAEILIMTGKRSRTDDLVDRMSATATAALGEPRDFRSGP